MSDQFGNYDGDGPDPEFEPDRCPICFCVIGSEHAPSCVYGIALKNPATVAASFIPPERRDEESIAAAEKMSDTPATCPNGLPVPCTCTYHAPPPPDLGSVPVVFSSALPVGSFFAHPDTVRLSQTVTALAEGMKRIADAMPSIAPPPFCARHGRNPAHDCPACNPPPPDADSILADQGVRAYVEATAPERPVVAPEQERMTETECLAGMLAADATLYEKCLDTPGFAYYFNAMARSLRRAREAEAKWMDAEVETRRIWRERVAAKETEIAQLEEIVRGYQTENDALAERIARLRAALEGVLGLIDSGYLVRDTSRDSEPGWVWKQLEPVMALRVARAALEGEKP